MKRIVACIPLSWDYIPSLFFHSWNKMNYYAYGKYDLMLITHSSCYMDTMRDALVLAARRHKPDYILWIDADQLYPEDTPEVLMKHIDTDKSVVGGLTPHSMTGAVNVWDFLHNDGIMLPRKVVPGHGVIRVDAMGMGGVMMKPEVFEKLNLPCFTMRWNSKLARYPGEDVQFYANCKKKGIDVWCDTNLVFGHIVTRAVTVEAAPDEKK
jgi:hypothetical protein